MTDLIDQLKQAQGDSFEKWFERWYEKQHLEDALVQSAQKGFTSYRIRIKSFPESEASFNSDRTYLARRLRDPRTVKKIKEKLGRGFTVTHESEDRELTFFGRRTGGTTYSDYLRIHWDLSEATL